MIQLLRIKILITKYIGLQWVLLFLRLQSKAAMWHHLRLKSSSVSNYGQPFNPTGTHRVSVGTPAAKFQLQIQTTTIAYRKQHLISTSFVAYCVIFLRAYCKIDPGRWISGILIKHVIADDLLEHSFPYAGERLHDLETMHRIILRFPENKKHNAVFRTCMAATRRMGKTVDSGTHLSIVKLERWRRV
ncbi:hypothetical protein V8G54_037403 [Vigna mungo]|uniref:Uncharacterized protein n=1 Tax=Vigna mungo TaxID=3915 RepID=A0AAQ3MK82_VIGMU